jgi:hypothetical protein
MKSVESGEYRRTLGVHTNLKQQARSVSREIFFAAFTYLTALHIENCAAQADTHRL